MAIDLDRLEEMEKAASLQLERGYLTGEDCRPLLDAVPHLLRELRAARAVVEVVSASIDGTWLETYCDVGSPDDCDHCVIVGAIEDYRRAMCAESEGEK